MKKKLSKLENWIFWIVVWIALAYMVHLSGKDSPHTNRQYKECMKEIHPFMNPEGFSEEEVKKIEETLEREIKKCEELL